MANKMGESGNNERFYFVGSKITAGDYCSHEIKRLLLLGRKAIQTYTAYLKKKDITLPTKLHLVKAMVFPVVTYRCESWTIKKAECQRTVVLEYALENPLDYKIKPFNAKGNQP